MSERLTAGQRQQWREHAELAAIHAAAGARIPRIDLPLETFVSLLDHIDALEANRARIRAACEPLMTVRVTEDTWGIVVPAHVWHQWRRDMEALLSKEAERS